MMCEGARRGSTHLTEPHETVNLCVCVCVFCFRWCVSCFVTSCSLPVQRGNTCCLGKGKNVGLYVTRRRCLGGAFRQVAGLYRS